MVEGLCAECRCFWVEMVEGFGGRGGCVPKVVASGLRWLRGLVVEGLCTEGRCSLVEMVEGCGGRGVVCRGSLFLG